MQRFDGNRFVDAEVAAEEDGAERAAAQNANQFVAVERERLVLRCVDLDSFCQRFQSQRPVRDGAGVEVRFVVVRGFGRGVGGCVRGLRVDQSRSSKSSISVRSSPISSNRAAPTESELLRSSKSLTWR